MRTICFLVYFWASLWSAPALSQTDPSVLLTLQRATLAAGEVALASAAEVRLPDSWNKSGRHGVWTYSLSFQLQELPTESWGIYVPRAGNRFSVLANGFDIGHVGEFIGDSSDFAQRPHFFFIPRDALRIGVNQLAITVQGDKARYAGLSSVTVGPVAKVRPTFVWRELMQTWGSFGILIVSAVFGVIAASLAYTTRDHVFSIFAAACAFCLVRTSYAVVTHVPFSYAYWHALVDTCYAGYLISLCWFSIRVLDIRLRFIKGLTLGLVGATMLLVPAYAFGQNAMARQAWLLVMVLYALCLALVIIYTWAKRRTSVTAVLATAAGISVMLGLYDHIAVFYTQDGYGAFALARYSLLFYLVAMGWVLVTRYAGQVKAERDFSQQLASELSTKTRELTEQFSRQELLVQEMAHIHERKRFMQDLHDSMGLQLNSLLVMVEKGEIRQAELTDEVRTAIEQMRMLVDSSQTFDGDFEQLLGHIRYRIETRLRHCGIALDWHADLQGVVPKFGNAATMALQRLVFELCTNVIKHARAKKVALRITQDNSQNNRLLLDFLDDGIGLQTSSSGSGSGLESIRRRLEELGAQAKTLTHTGGGLHYRIEIPYRVG